MNAATPEDEQNAERETGVPTPTLVLMRTRKEPRAAGSPSRADGAPRGGRRPCRDIQAVALHGGPAYRHRPVADQVAAR
jgi:hypothetical protein